MQSGTSPEENSHKKAIMIIHYILSKILFQFGTKRGVQDRNKFFTWLKAFGGIPVAMIIYSEDRREGWENDILKIMFQEISSNSGTEAD